MRTLWTVISAFFMLSLTGCAIPQAAMIGTSAGDNATYYKTRKSMLDVALSEMLDGDCTVMHGFTRGEFCRPVPKSPIVEDLPPEPEAGIPDSVGAALEASVPVSTDAKPADTEVRPSPAPARVAAAPRREPRYTIVLGIYANYEQAKNLAAKLKPRRGIVSSIIVRGEVFYRVTTRPFSLDDAATNEKQVAEVGFPDAKMIAVCPRWMQDESCVVLD